MRSWINRAAIGPIAAGALALAAGSVCWGQQEEDAILPISGLRLPMDFYEDGKVRCQLFADSAKVPNQGNIEACNVRVEFYREDGSLEVVMIAEDCRYDREKGTATSQSDVRMERGGVIIRGKGFEWNAKDQVVRILSAARVVVKQDQETGAILIPRGGPAPQTDRGE